MRKNRCTSGILGLAVLSLVIVGCHLVSGTFVIVESFSFTTQTGFYRYEVDITDEEKWEDHKDDISRINVVGFELWITNNESVDVTFNAYIDDADATFYSTYAEVDANATKIIDDLTLAAGPGMVTHITYAQSFNYLRNVGELKRLTKEGRFHCYCVSDGGTYSAFIVDSGKVIITFSAGGI